MRRALVMAMTALVIVCCVASSDVLAHPAWGIAVDRRQQVYFTDLENIWKLDAQGRLTLFRRGASGRHTHDLRIGEDGNLYGEDHSYEPSTQRFINALWKMTPTGEFKYILAPTTDAPKGMSLWQDSEGNMYSALWKSNTERDLLILKRTPDGRLTTLYGDANVAARLNPGILYNVGGMAFAPDGSLYLTDGPSVRRVTKDGTVTTVTRNLSVEKPANNPLGTGPEMRLFGLAADAEGNIFAADHSNRRVLKIAPGKDASTVLRAESPWSPTGVAVSGSDLYILEIGFTPPRTYLGPRVRKLSADGKISVLATLTESQRTSREAGATSASGSSGENPEGASVSDAQRASTLSRRSRYALFLVAVGVCALGLIIWRVRRRVTVREPLVKSQKQVTSSDS